MIQSKTKREVIIIAVKKETRLIILAVCSLGISFGYIGYTYYHQEQLKIQNEQKQKKVKQKTPYLSKMEKDKKILITTKESKVKLLNQKEGTYLVYFYSTDCDYCKELAPTLNNFIEQKEPHNLYFVNTDAVLDDEYIYLDTDDDDNSDKTQELIGKSEEDPTSWLIGGTPTIFKIEDHKITKIYAGASQIKELLKEVGVFY